MALISRRIASLINELQKIRSLWPIAIASKLLSVSSNSLCWGNTVRICSLSFMLDRIFSRNALSSINYTLLCKANILICSLLAILAILSVLRDLTKGENPAQLPLLCFTSIPVAWILLVQKLHL